MTSDSIEVAGDGIAHVTTVRQTNRDGMTLDELASWVQRAMTAEVPGSAVVMARVSFRGKLQQVAAHT